jgi:tetratricopeptide (TPR) repeat protein
MSTAAAPKSPLKVDADYVTCQNKSGDEAIAGCDRAIASGKFDDELLSDLYNGRGVERQNKGELDAAQADFAEAMRLNPKNAFAYGNRGRLNLVKKDYDAAITDYNKAIEISPTYLSAYTGRGDAYLKKHDPGRAIEEYKKALALKPKAELKQRIERALSEAYSNHGLAQKDDAAAISDYDEALKLNPDNYAALNNRGAAFVRTGDYDRAIQDLDSALKLKTDSSVLFRNRGDAYRGKGDRERAIEDYKQALSLNPSEQTKKAVEAALAALTSTGGAPNEAKPAAPSGQAPEAAPAAQSNPARQDESGQIDFGDQ